MGKDSPSPPPAPDYSGAAVATAAGNADAARIGAKANRVNQYTPYGNLTYTPGVNGDQDQWRADISLSPTGQKLLDSNNAISLGLGQLGQQGLGYVQNTLDKPFDWGAVPNAPVNPGTTGQEAVMARLQPQLERQRSLLDTQLKNQGLMMGSEAYKEAMMEQGRRENDLLSQAALQGIGLDTQARQQGIQEQSFARNEPLNMLNAVRTGSQVQNPNFVNVPQQQTVPGPNYMGADQAQAQYNQGAYNAQQAGNNSMMSGLFSLGGAAIGSPWFGGLMRIG